jgi:hypothetical protein
MSNRRLFNHTAILLTGLCSVADPLAFQSDHYELYIEEIETNGKGCPKDDPNTVETVISDDKKSFVLLYRDMELTNPPGPKVKNLHCQAAVELHLPAGYQIALATVNTRGYLYLEDDIEARLTSGYSFAGVPLGSHPHTSIEGPYDDFYESSDDIPVESWVWSDCGGSVIFEINTGLKLDATANPDGQAIFSTNTTDGVFRVICHWQIRKC